VGVGTGCRHLEVPRRAPLTPPSIRPTRPRASRPSLTRKLRPLGAALHCGRPRSQGPHLHRRQEGQFLDDGRHRSVRSVLGAARGPHANGDTKGALVNQGSAQCIEIWNLVFMQFNANPDGTFAPLPARSVDTGMGFERVTGIIQNTRGFTDFSRVISNYETDIFRPLFDALERMSGRSTPARCRPWSGGTGDLGSTGDSPVPVGDPPTGAPAGVDSAGLPAQRHGRVPVAPNLRRVRPTRSGTFTLREALAIYHIIIHTVRRTDSVAARI